MIIMSTVENDAKQLAKTVGDSLAGVNDLQPYFDKLSELQIHLDSDPLALGPKRLQGHIAHARSCLVVCENILLEISNRIRITKRQLSAKRTALDIATKQLFVMDPDVRAGKSVSDRNAIASVKMKDEWLEVERLSLIQDDLESLHTVIVAKRSDLKDAQARIRDQMSLCQAELSLGGKWGDTYFTSVPDHISKVSPSISVDSLIASVEQQIHLPEMTEDEFSEALESTVTLDKPSVQSEIEDIDVDALVSSIQIQSVPKKDSSVSELESLMDMLGVG